MPNYEYSELPVPLNPAHHSIRLLKLNSGVREDPICATVFDTILEDCQPYEALSYCWGDANSLVEIFLNGKYSMVTSNLYTALAYLRHTASDRILWIDAICINQNDIDEKSSQISLMRHIYETAERGVVWLGELGVLAELGIGLLFRLLELSRTGKVWKIEDTLEEWLENDLPLPRQAPWKGLGLILSSPWFTRKWIIQEVATPKSVTILIGSQEIEWEDMAAAILFAVNSNLTRMIDTLDFSSCILMDFLRKMYQQGSHMPLLWLLSAFSDHNASDPRDHIYALLALVEDNWEGSFDYDLTFVQLSTLITRMLCAETKQLDSLKYAYGKFRDQDSSSSIETFHLNNLPSWVADWRSSDKYQGPSPLAGAFGYLEGFSGGLFSATNGSKYIPQFPELPGYMTVQGTVVDTITSIGDPFNYESLGLLFRLLDWQAMAHRLVRHNYSSDRDFNKTFCETVLGGMSIRHSQSKFSTRDFKLVRDFLEYLVAWKSSGLPETGNYAYDHPEYLLTNSKLRSCCKGRRLILTSRGHLGLVPERARIADKICLVIGSNVPFIMQMADKSSWHLVGHGFINGIMNGEAFVKEDCHNIQLV